MFGEFALQSPELLSNMRILPPWLDFYSDDLDDASPAHEAKMAEMIKRDVDTLHRYDRTALDRDGGLSYDVLDYFLSIQVEGDRFRDYDFPVNQLSGIQSSLPNFMAQTHQVNNKHDADAYIARLDKFPLKFGQVVEGLKLRESKGVIPPQFTVEEVLTQMQGFIGKPAEGKYAVHELQGEARQDSGGQDGSADARHSARRASPARSTRASIPRIDSSSIISRRCSRKRRAISARGICRTATRITRGACACTRRPT